jgi:hypothetical protein
MVVEIRAGLCQNNAPIWTGGNDFRVMTRPQRIRDGWMSTPFDPQLRLRPTPKCLVEQSLALVEV